VERKGKEREINEIEIAGLDNDGPTKMQGWTLHDWTL